MKLIFLFIPIFIILSCGTNNESSNNDKSLESGIIEVSPLVMERGLTVYKAHCFACHQMSGKGMKALYPPLAENKTVTGDKEALIAIILKGMSGEIVVNGEKYNQVMIPHDFLNDNQIADVLTYIRNSFGNKAEPVTHQEVKLIRKNLK